jgi:two-component system chemotaxis response regulator CheY
VSSLAANEIGTAVSVGALKVLIADDDESCRDSLQDAVRCLGHSCNAARDGIEAWEMYEADRADVILSDWKMPRMDGLRLCQKVRMRDSERFYTHFIFVTGNSDKAHFIHGMHAGADDYISKPVDLDELQARLEAARRVVLLHRQLREHNSSLRHDSEREHLAARTDPLTAASNRLALKEDLTALAARAARYGHKFCAALCDIDEFKIYNDYFGHLSGDEALRSVAHAIHGGLRRGDFFYRYGGEEFLVILPEQTITEAALGMGRIRQAVERLAIPHAPTAAMPVVTISVGISALSGAPTESIDGWLRRTDAALYLAKAHGRNRVTLEGAA